MLKWIETHKWLPEIILFSIYFLILGGADLVVQGVPALVTSIFAVLPILFVRRLNYLVPLCLAVSIFLQFYFNIFPPFSVFVSPLIVFLAGALTTGIWKGLILASFLVSGLASAAHSSFNSSLQTVLTRLGASEEERISFFVVLSLLVISLTFLGWILGILLATRIVHVGTEVDRVISEDRQAKLAIELAEQAERFGIAKDINELVVQQVAAVISQAEGGIYASKTNPAAGLRALERILASGKSAQLELRRLFEMLSRGQLAASVPPSLEDLESLAVTFRGMGLDVVVNNFGEEFPLTAGAELAIYRIIFDSLQNVRQHNPAGTAATVDISWTRNGLQVYVKDNGVEVVRKAAAASDGTDAGYSVQDDLEALVEKVAGAGITSMRERAETYGGSLEAFRVVGVGFTVSAVFPDSQTRLG